MTAPPDAHDRVSVSAFVREDGRGVVATVSAHGLPEAALVGLAGLASGELVFNAALTSRKISNLRRQPAVAVVVGTAGEVSVQLEGLARLVEGEERTRYGAEYESQQPGSRALDEDFALVVVRPTWVRVYDASQAPATVSEASWSAAVT